MIRDSIEIDCRVEDAFAYLEQLERHGEWQAEIVSTTVVTEGPVRGGTRVREIRRIGGRERDSSYEITEHDPPHKHSFRGITGLITPVGAVTLEPVGRSRTRVSIEFNLIGRGVGRLLAPLARRAARKSVIDSQRRFKAELERGEPHAGQSGQEPAHATRG
ncbi:MAG: SRPBCC family protein [Solirubrobacterales bacterium]|nr:SRPBCC family protein [Solirubrobacterales bacterium]